jgi:hypothetical protein
MSTRVDPFTLVFGVLADERFPALKASLASGGKDPFDRDAFILDQAVTEFLRDLVPEEAPPESLHEFIAVLQHGYLFWEAGRRTIVAGTELPAGSTARPADRPTAYLLLPSHLYWAQLEPDEPHEPLDGFFVHPSRQGIRALAIFGVHPERPGFSVAEVAGSAPGTLLPRPDGSAPFAPLMDGGAAAGLRSVAGPDELLALAWASLPPTILQPHHPE